MTPDFTNVHLWDRLAWAAANLDPVQTEFRVVYDPPLGDGAPAPAAILVPDPNWMAAALAGGILPPVEMYHREERDAAGNFIGPADYWIAYEALPPMTEEEAIEYLIKKDIPREVWDTPEGRNSSSFAICRVDQLPKTREYRNAWRLAA
ncbi:hypothetical protein [Microvirga sp. Mcv34]|uniref:hypothetical protein n=1 Tax=Microvirga sp. Mcv34 TaxID=2926016 RepID=UPI0021C64043|nr:hypothetical protein [Microvirga sp. Mcv34]